MSTVETHAPLTGGERPRVPHGGRPHGERVETHAPLTGGERPIASAEVGVTGVLKPTLPSPEGSDSEVEKLGGSARLKPTLPSPEGSDAYPPMM